MYKVCIILDEDEFENLRKPFRVYIVFPYTDVLRILPMQKDSFSLALLLLTFNILTVVFWTSPCKRSLKASKQTLLEDKSSSVSDLLTFSAFPISWQPSIPKPFQLRFRLWISVLDWNNKKDTLQGTACRIDMPDKAAMHTHYFYSDYLRILLIYLTHLCRVDSSTLTIWTGQFPI